MQHDGGQQISTALARQLVKNYKHEKRAKGKIGKDDTHAIWFSRESLLEMLAVQSPGTAPISGIRFYIAAYPKSQQGGIPKEKKNLDKLTLVMVQTFDVDDEHVEILSEPNDTPKYPKMLEYNDGQLCPPPICPTHGLLKFTD